MSEASAGPGEASVEEALARARRHARASAAEAIAALGALMEAGVLAAGRSPTAGMLAPLSETLDNLRSWLDPDGGRNAADVLDGVTEVLDEEIARWETRSREDPEARSVLRAFLAVREVLFEVARRKTSEATPRTGAEAGEASPAPSPPRVQRVSVEG